MIEARVWKRLAALVLLIAPVAGIWLIVIAPALSQIERDKAAIVQSKTLLARYQQLEGELPRLQQQVNELATSKSKISGYFESGSAAMLSAQLQSNVQRIVGASGLALRSSHTLPPEEDQGLKRIGLQIELAVSPPGLQRLLHSIETASPALFIRKLSVRAPENGVSGLDAAGQPTETATLVIAGYTMELKK